jgi:Mg2+-importing ATPase
MVSIGIVILGATLPFTPIGSFFGFVAPPVKFYLVLAVMVVIYLIFVELAKQAFYRWVGKQLRKKLLKQGHRI